MRAYKYGIIIFITLASVLQGETLFSNLDLDSNNQLLFSADHGENYQDGNYTAVLSASLDDQSVRLLTHYPEKSFLTSNGQTLFLWNRFGLYQYDMEEKGMPGLISIYPSPEKGDTVQLGKLAPISISPDGKYIIYFRATDWSRGDMILYDREKQYGQLLSSGVDLDYSSKNIRWSPDSRFFVYAREGYLYYFSLDKYLAGELPDENARVLGEGRPGSFLWGSDNRLFYIKGKEVLTVHSSEMFALSFYDSPLQLGTVAGELFFSFNPNFDSFAVSPDGQYVLIEREEGAIFVLNLEFRNYNDYSEIKKFPFLRLPAGHKIKKHIWAKSGKLILLVGSELTDEQENRLYIYDPGENRDAFQETNHRGVIDIAISDSEENAALLFSNNVDIRDMDRWSLLRSQALNSALSVYWAGEREVLILGKKTNSLYHVSTDYLEPLFFSQCDQFGYSLEGDIKLQQGKDYYILEDDKWQGTADHFFKERNIFNETFRVFLSSNNAPLVYDNSVMIRRIDGFGTVPLLDDLKISPEPLPGEDDFSPDSTFFNHGSRIRRREVAFAFNITRDTTGLMDILNDLAEYNLKSTFFVNGDAVRKYPLAMEKLSKTDHEIGSLFYTVMDMTDRRYNLDSEFIKRGLARNEDDYFRATGAELLTLWHAPWYFVNSQIVEASEEMNYTYVGRDMETLDWVGKEDDFLYQTSAEIISRIMEQKQPGSIITITVGTPSERDDYLFQNLELLINGLIKEGYEIVPVGKLMEHGK